MKIRDFLRLLLTALFLIFTVMGCNFYPGGLAAKSDTVNEWTLSRSADTTGTALTVITKNFETTEFEGEIELTGSDAAINKILGGQWEIGFSTESGDTVLLANKTDKGSTTEQTKDLDTVSFKVDVHPKSAAKSTNFGGSLSAGNTLWLQKDAIWWGASAWCTPYTGNTDLELWWNDWGGTWIQVSTSSNPGTQMDQVSYTHGIYWGNYKLVIKAVADSGFTGQVSW